MRVRPVTLAVIFLLVTSLPWMTAQERRLSPLARQLTDALKELKKKPADPIVQERYLKVFPRDYRTFLKLFEPKRELYDGFDFIHVLPTLAEHHDMEVGILLVGLSAHARWDADAPNYLQEATVTYASQHTKSFVVVIGRMSPAEKRSVITFLADKENHSAYQEYQDTIDHLRRLGENNLANEFEAARKKRSQQPHG